MNPFRTEDSGAGAKIAAAYAALLARFVAWAEAQPDLTAALVIGSRARSDHPADRWSDLDLLVIVEDPNRYMADSRWVAQMGEPWITFVERTADGRFWERRVLYAGGLDVDYALIPAPAMRDLLAAPHLPADIADAFRRGLRSLVDKEGALAGLDARLDPPTPAPPPSQREFDELVNDFWYHCVWSAKHLCRGELWWAKSGCDMHLKSRLQRMLEWHARARFGRQHDTWLRGRFLEEWVDPRARAALPAIFAHYAADDIARALWATMDLFGWTAGESAAAYGLEFPAAVEEHAVELVQEILPR